MAHMTYFTMVISNCFVVQEMGDYLIVALSTDEFNQIKHKNLIMIMNNENDA